MGKKLAQMRSETCMQPFNDTLPGELLFDESASPLPHPASQVTVREKDVKAFSNRVHIRNNEARVPREHSLWGSARVACEQREP